MFFVYDKFQHQCYWRVSLSNSDKIRILNSYIYRSKTLGEIQFIQLDGDTLSNNPFVSPFFNTKKEQKKVELVDFEELKSQCKIKNIPALKSLLQKCVRRQMTSMALKCAKPYIIMNIVSFLRRLIIIACEDVFLDINLFHIICWFYMSIKLTDYKITMDDVDCLMSIVKCLCEENNHFDILHMDTSEETKDIPYIHKFNFKLSEKWMSMILSLKLYCLQTKFTLEGDERMFYNWLHNCENICKKQEEIKFQFQPGLFNDIICISRDEYDIVGIDFHNYPFILDKLHQYYPYLNKDIIKKTIWHCRSGINHRKKEIKIDDCYNQTYNKIREQLENICMDILYHMY